MRGRTGRAPRRRRQDGNLGAVPRRPACSRRRSTRTPTGSSSAASTSARPSRAQIVCGAWNFGAGATVAVALPGASCPNGLTLERRKLRGEVSEGMILAEDEIDLGTDHSRDHAPRRRARAGHAARRRAAARRGRPRGRATGNRPDLLSVYGFAREVAALFDVRARAVPGRRAGRATATSRSTSTSTTSTAARATSARLFRDVEIGAVAALAEGAALARRHAADLERRRRDELRHARARQPAARLRLDTLARRADRRPPRAAGRAAAHARRHGAHARRRATW